MSGIKYVSGKLYYRNAAKELVELSIAGGGPHASAHAAAGSDPITPASIGAETSGAATAAVNSHLSEFAHGSFVGTSDSRLSDARTPTAHAAAHATGQADAIAPAAIGAAAADHTHAGGDNIVRLSADRQSTSTSLADCTGLSFSAEAGATYLVEFFVYYVLANATYGIQLAVNGPAAPTAVAMNVIGCTAASTLGGRVANAYNTAANLGAGIAGVNFAKVQGLFLNGANAGTLTLRYAAENASGAVTVKAGSTLRYRKVS